MSDMTPPEPAAAPEPAPLPVVPARPGRARRLILTGLPVVLVAGALVGAAVYTKATVDRADRSVKTMVWADSTAEPAKDPAVDATRGRATTELSKLLLPAPDGYRLGPDVRGHGNDSEVSGKKATAAMKESNRGLAGKQRRAFDKRIDRLRIQGLASRSYVSGDNVLMIDTEIMKMKDKKAVRSLYTFQTELFDAVGIFRDGPKIKGHTRNATCFLEPKSKIKIESMMCMAYDGELSISISASGTKPFDKAAVAELLKDQLDHIKSPGEYV